MPKTTQPSLFRVVGLMSGTSLDGIDAALIETDGRAHIKPIAFHTVPYKAVFRDQLRRCLGNVYGVRDPYVAEIEKQLTTLLAKAVMALLEKTGNVAGAIDLDGFHGQTIFHNPKIRKTIQIGDGEMLAQALKIPVVNNFRLADVLSGGQGAPLVPVYHQALFAKHNKPVAVLNIGGVANVTWLGEGDDMIAFDIGPGNALIDDWMQQKAGKPFDRHGAAAALGHADWAHVRAFLRHDYFTQAFPKSLDRDAFKMFMPEHLGLMDGAATLTMMTVTSICRGLDLLNNKPTVLYVTGGGRHNALVMEQLHKLLDIPVRAIEHAGFNGDALEAEAFAYLAVRSKLGLPISFPMTTGVPRPMTGGQLRN